MIPTSRPSVYLVVLNWNGFEDTKQCIESLLSVNYENLHIIIVDNASTDGSGSLLRATFPDICFVQSKENGGYAGGMNIGISTALSKNAGFIVLMNNDLVVTSNFIHPFVEICEKDPSVGIVSPKVLYKDRKEYIYCAGGKISYLLCSGISMYQGKLHEKFGNDNRKTNMAEGSCLCVRASVFTSVGYFDTRYFMYFEDLDFSSRVDKKYGIMYTPASVVYHKSGAGHSWLLHTPLYQYYYTRNRMWFFSSSNFFYRCYVLVFSALVVVLKSMVMLMNRSKVSDFSSSTRALWKGLLNGTTLLFKSARVRS